MPQLYETGSCFMRKPAIDGKFPTAVLLRPNLARGRPFSRLSFAAMRLFDENLFQTTGRRCFCPPSTQSADRRAVSISKEKRAFPLAGISETARTGSPAERRSRKSDAKSAGVSDSLAPAICILPFHPAYPDLRRQKKQTSHRRLRAANPKNQGAAEWLAPHSGSFVSSKQPQYRHLAG